MHWSRFVKVAVASALLAMVASAGSVVYATHAWGVYHWARKTSSFDLIVINSTTADWDGYVSLAIIDWTKSPVINLVEDPYGSTSDRDRRSCRAPDGKVRICNYTYGPNGWLGIAGISIDPAGHIVSGYTKLNDTYFAMTTYNRSDWKQSVTCQELGHNIGLGHQDENFNNDSLLSCMDYQNPPYPSANDHDLEQLAAIYGHTDSYNSYAAADTGGGDGSVSCTGPGKGCNRSSTGQNNAEAGWGISLGRRGPQEKFLRIDPDGARHVTFVTWVDGH